MGRKESNQTNKSPLHRFALICLVCLFDKSEHYTYVFDESGNSSTSSDEDLQEKLNTSQNTNVLISS